MYIGARESKMAVGLITGLPNEDYESMKKLWIGYQIKIIMLTE